jgi:hypothetical protein
MVSHTVLEVCYISKLSLVHCVCNTDDTSHHISRGNDDEEDEEFD